MEVRRQAYHEMMPAYFAAYREAWPDARLDAWPSTLSRAVSRLSLSLLEPIRRGKRAAPGIANDVATVGRSAWRRWAARAIGVDIFRPRGEGGIIRDLSRSWSLENSKLISSLAERYQEQVAQRAQDMVRSGIPPRQFAAELERQYGLATSRARLIARTETAKLNGQITRARQMALGIEIYIWSTSDDERVRESHKVLEGKECRWDDPEVYREIGETTWKSRRSIGAFIGHPGEDFQCRCVAAANTDSLLDALEAA